MPPFRQVDFFPLISRTNSINTFFRHIALKLINLNFEESSTFLSKHKRKLLYIGHHFSGDIIIFIGQWKKAIFALIFIKSHTCEASCLPPSLIHFRSIESKQWNSIFSNESQTCSSFAHLWKLARSQWTKERKETKEMERDAQCVK